MNRITNNSEESWSLWEFDFNEMLHDIQMDAGCCCETCGYLSIFSQASVCTKHNIDTYKSGYCEDYKRQKRGLNK